MMSCSFSNWDQVYVATAKKMQNIETCIPGSSTSLHRPAKRGEGNLKNTIPTYKGVNLKNTTPTSEGVNLKKTIPICKNDLKNTIQTRKNTTIDFFSMSHHALFYMVHFDAKLFPVHKFWNALVMQHQI